MLQWSVLFWIVVAKLPVIGSEAAGDRAFVMLRKFFFLRVYIKYKC